MGRRSSSLVQRSFKPKCPRKLKKALRQIRIEFPQNPFEFKEIENPDGSMRVVLDCPFRIVYEGKDNKWKRKARAKAMDEYKRKILRELKRMYNL